MSANVKVPDTEKIPMAASQHEAAVHPVQTPMYPVPQSRGCEKKITIKNPEQVHRIIFDPSLEPA
jgi:hypothetical protein